MSIKLIKNKLIARWLWHSSKGVRLQATLNGIIGTVDVVCSLAFVWACKYAIDIATGDAEGKLLQAAILLGVLILIRILLGATDRWIANILGVRAQNLMRKNLFSRLLQGEWCGLAKHHTGDIINRLELDVNSVVKLMTDIIPVVVVVLFQLIASFLFLFSMDKTLAVITVLIMPFFALFSKVYVSKMRKMNREVRESDSQIQSVIQESLQHKTLIKTLERNDLVEDRLSGLQDTLHSQVKRRTRFSIFSFSIVRAGFSIGYLVAFIWGVTGISEGTITFGIMTAFLQLVGQVQRPIMDLAKLIPGFVGALTATERLIELDELPTEEKGTPQLLPDVAGVRFQNVDFGYGDEKALLKGFTFDFPPHSSTAILGETGAGKTTLIRLMLALIKPEKGNITIYNDKNNYQISPQTRCNFVYVPQGNSLFSGTVRDNLLLGNPNATEQEMKEVLHTSCADFVLSLPNALETLCGEQGGGLSEGQAQRIAIARSLLRDGSILVLDEVTSALDEETENELLKRLTAEKAGKTLIFVTHRTAIVEHCSQVLRLNSINS